MKEKLPAASLLPVVEQEPMKRVNKGAAIWGESLFRWDPVAQRVQPCETEGSQAGLSLTVSTRTSDVISVNTVGQ